VGGPHRPAAHKAGLPAPSLIVLHEMDNDRPMDLTVRVDDGGPSLLLVVRGELDLMAAARVSGAVGDELRKPVAADLSEVTFMDSSGLRVLLEVKAACDRAGVDFTLVRPSEAVMRVLELVELKGEFEISREAVG
jgi:anti-anti-sigma factor